MNKSRFAFTMVELLVVMAIVMVLLGLVMPAVVRAQQRARETTCVANLKKLAVAVELYSQNEGGHPVNNIEFPPLVKVLGEKIRCYRQQRANDSYYLQGPDFTWKLDPGMRGHSSCYESRGSSWPVAYDPNHWGPRAELETGKSVYIFARLDTSVHVVSREAHLGKRASWPCPDLPMEVNF
jgi:type II secretory pathway pseudopilin PulG